MNDTRKQHPCPNHDTSRMRVNRLLAEAILDQQAAHDAVLVKQSLAKVKRRLSRAFETAINQDMVEAVEAYSTAGEHCEKVRTTLDTYMRCLSNSMSYLSHVSDDNLANLGEQAYMLAVRYLHATDVYRKSGGIWWDAEFTFKTFVAPEKMGADTGYQALRSVLEPFGFQQTSHSQIGKEVGCVNRHLYTIATTVEGLCALLLAKRIHKVGAMLPEIERSVFFVPNLCHAQDADCRTPQQALERKDATDPIVSESMVAFDSVWLEKTGTPDANALSRRFALGVLTQLLPRQAHPHAKYTVKCGDGGRAYTLCDNAAHCIPEHRPNPQQYPRPSRSDSEVA
ncbi:MAG TPA: hypothetical protein VFA48_06240 [Gammaproteobacteria bacterium]|nr:hypothetical protein [Gammaproteobacteria bacterium]